MKPMLASPADFDNCTWPKLVSPKLDGIRALIIDGVVLSRSLKPIPNEYVQVLFGRHEYNGLDGELIVGPVNAQDVYRVTNSGVMSKNGTPDVSLHVFDDFSAPDRPFTHRLESVHERTYGSFAIEAVPQSHMSKVGALDLYKTYLDDGFEGIMLRDPAAPYKFGRSTAREGMLLKHKPLVDSEAVVLEVFEQMRNENEATVNELGRTSRSSHQDNKVGKGTTGGFVARDVHSGIEFNVGIFLGATDADRMAWWADKPIGKIFKYTSLSIGVKEKPRHPRWTGWRSPLDMS